MLFLIKYRKSFGHLELLSLDVSKRGMVEDMRFLLELAYKNDADMEIVILEAQSLEALRLTHGRYF